jgi:tetratricopeptide (TPR) repeat protein
MNDAYNLHWAYYLKARHEMESSKVDLAIRTLSQAIGSIQKSELVHQSKMSFNLWYSGTLSIIYSDLNDYSNALKYLEIARESFQESEKTINDHNLMNLFEAVPAFQNGDYEKAISYLIQPALASSTSCQYYLARAYELSGQHHQALKYYEMLSQNTDPHFAGLYYNISKERIKELERELADREL